MPKSRKNFSQVYGYHAVTSLLQSNPAAITELYLLDTRDDKRLQQLRTTLQKLRITPIASNREQLAQLTNNGNHQGIVAIINDATPQLANNITLEDLLQQDNTDKNLFFLILDGVQDPHNLGACLRTANAAGVSAVIIPKDNAVGLTATVRKVACGAAETTPLIQVPNLARAIEMLKKHNVWFYGADAEATQSLYATKLTGNIALVLGAEGTGLRRLTKELCDQLISIPMSGDVASLNVSVATGICLFEVVRQSRSSISKPIA